MTWLTLDKWPIVFICLAMIVAAVIDGWKLKVPNWLTFPLILSGWLLGILHYFEVPLGESGQGTFGASLAGTALGLVLLLPIYAIGGMGAGDVKMQMGFGAWVGAFFGTRAGLEIIFWAFCVGAIVGGVIGLGMMIARGKYRHNLQNVRAILSNMIASGGNVSKMAEKGNEIRAREPKLPYGIPLCIGFVSYLVFYADIYLNMQG
jgi:prepilin peptidase CpaA